MIEAALGGLQLTRAGPGGAAGALRKSSDAFLEGWWGRCRPPSLRSLVWRSGDLPTPSRRLGEGTLNSRSMREDAYL